MELLRMVDIPFRSWLGRLRAQACLASGRLEEADRTYSELVSRQPGETRSWLALGRIRTRLKNWPQAREAWSQVVARRPGDIEARWELASACWTLGFRDEARSHVDWILERDENHRRALTLLARSLFEAEPERSLACWARLAAMNPQGAEPHLQMARLHARAGRDAEAEAAFRAVLARAPTHPEGLAKLALMVGPRDEQEAAALLSRWSGTTSTDIAAWLALADTYVAVGKPAAAEATLRRGLAIAPNDVGALMLLGRLLANAEKFDQALEIWKKLADLGPQSLEPQVQIALHIARCYHNRADPEAETYLRDILGQDPTCLHALQYLGEVLGEDDERVGEAADVPLEQPSSDIGDVSRDLMQLHREWMELQDAARQPEDDFYKTKVANDSPFEVYEVAIAELIAERFAKDTTRIVEIGAGWGGLAILLARLGYEVFGFEGNARRHEACKWHFRRQIASFPILRRRLRLVPLGMFPEVFPPYVLSKHKTNLCIATNITNSYTAQHEHEVLLAAARCDELILDLARFGVVATTRPRRTSCSVA
jgi:tetratricopeptide (TPR) repeat protein